MSKRVLAAFGATVALVGQAVGASADPGEATHIDSLSASAGASTVTVSGGATFVDVPLIVNESGTGSALIPGIGTDIAGATVNKPLTGTSIIFRMNIGDPAPEPAIAPPHTAAFIWGLAIEQADGSMLEYELHAMRSGQVSTNPTFNLYRCPVDPNTGVGNCSSAGSITGRFVTGLVEFTVPQVRFGAGVKEIFPGGDNMVVVTSAAGFFWGVIALERAAMDFSFKVPSREVKIGLAPVGTPEDEIELDKTATVNASSGAYTSTFAKPAPGEYVVVARACYGTGGYDEPNCGTQTMTLTV